MRKFLLFDRGAYLFFAQALASAGDQVWYYNASQDFMAKSSDAIVGRGYPGVDRVDSFWAYLDDADTIVFPDVGDGDLQHYLRQKGHHVWGSGKSEMLELDRWQFLKLLEDMSEAVPETERVLGIPELRKALRSREEDCWLKTSFFRGDFETQHCERYDILKPWIDDLALRLGPRADDIEILIQESLEGVEPGYDGYCINGQFPKAACWGWEAKDSSYVGKTSDFNEMPQALRETAEIMSMPLRTLGMQGSFHSEVRVAKNGQAYLTDPTCRLGSPPGEVMSMLITNWPDIVTAGARGKVVEPEFAAKYGCQIMLKSTYWVLEHFLPVGIPKELEPYLQLRRGTILDGKLWAVPSEDLELIGSALGIGDTVDEACEMALEVAGAIEALELSFDKQADETLKKIVEDGEKEFGESF